MSLSLTVVPKKIRSNVMNVYFLNFQQFIIDPKKKEQQDLSQESFFLRKQNKTMRLFHFDAFVCVCRDRIKI